MNSDNGIKSIDELVTNEIYQLTDTQFKVTLKVKCLGNYGTLDGEKVFFTKENSGETPESLAEKFKTHRLPDAFVCWDFMLGTKYIIKSLKTPKTMKNSEKITQILAKLAEQDKLPLDITELDSSLFEEFNQPENVENPQIKFNHVAYVEVGSSDLLELNYIADMDGTDQVLISADNLKSSDYATEIDDADLVQFINDVLEKVPTDIDIIFHT
jgi:hypothetical protein